VYGSGFRSLYAAIPRWKRQLKRKKDPLRGIGRPERRTRTILALCPCLIHSREEQGAVILGVREGGGYSRGLAGKAKIATRSSIYHVLSGGVSRKRVQRGRASFVCLKEVNQGEGTKGVSRRFFSEITRPVRTSFWSNER